MDGRRSSSAGQIISETEIMNINCLSVDAPMSVFENFGFQSGKLSDKFRYITFSRSKNGLAVLSDYINSFISLKVEQYLDFDTHGMFICSVTDAETINNNKSMTYSYYHENVKPKPKKTNKKGYICKICGYIHEGELPDDFICPLCKHGVADFEPINIKEEKEMKKYVCDACGWVYDEELGAPDLGIAPGTKFEDLPEDFACPLCGVGKDTFSEE